MDLSLETLLQWFSAYAYQPEIVYLAVIGLMFGSSFGMPVPEEVTLVSLGLLCFAARHPELFPPSETGASPIDPVTAAIVALLAVFMSDLLVFLIGKYSGPRLLKTKLFRRFANPGAWAKITAWVERYGAWACGIFRFTPGLRFPGHLACGMAGCPTWKFVAVDGTAVLLSVPTQVLLIAYYGDSILVYLKQFKIGLGILLALFIIYFIGKKIIAYWSRAKV